MARRILLFVTTVLLFNGGFADILVQPGYGQPHPIVQQEANQPRVAAKTINSLPESGTPGNWYTPSATGSHAELPYFYATLEPIYPDPYGRSSMVGNPMYYNQQPMHFPPFINRHPHMTRSGPYAYPGSSLYDDQPYFPPAAPNRNKRSVDEGSNSGEKTVNAYAVAPQSPLNIDSQAITDLQSQDEKRLETRQSKADSDVTGDNLLGLNPSRMYPGHHQIHMTEKEMATKSNSAPPTNSPNKRMNQQLSEQQSFNTIPQINPQTVRNSMMSQMTDNEAQLSYQNTQELRNNQLMNRIMSNAVPNVNQYNSVGNNEAPNWRQFTPQQASQILQSPNNMMVERNFPDPRPAPTTGPVLQMAESNWRRQPWSSNSNNAQVNEHQGTSRDNNGKSDPILGTSKKLKKLKPPKNVKNIDIYQESDYSYPPPPPYAAPPSYPFRNNYPLEHNYPPQHSCPVQQNCPPCPCMQQQTCNCPCSAPSQDYVIYQNNDPYNILKTGAIKIGSLYQLPANSGATLLHQRNCGSSAAIYGNYAQRYASAPAYGTSITIS